MASHITVYAEILAKRKFLPISPSGLSGVIFYHVNYLFCVNDCKEDNIMVTFTTLAKIYSTEYFCKKVSGLGEIFAK